MRRLSCPLHFTLTVVVILLVIALISTVLFYFFQERWIYLIFGPCLFILVLLIFGQQVETMPKLHYKKILMYGSKKKKIVMDCEKCDIQKDCSVFETF